MSFVLLAGRQLKELQALLLSAYSRRGDLERMLLFRLEKNLNQIATSRQNVAASSRTPFYLYIDEFHNFITPSLAAILSGARKYNLGLILAHQELHQLSTRDTDVASAVIANPYTRVCFRLGDFDAKKLEDGFLRCVPAQRILRLRNWRLRMHQCRQQDHR